MNENINEHKTNYLKEYNYLICKELYRNEECNENCNQCEYDYQ